MPNDQSQTADHEIIVAEGTAGGESFQVTAYTWVAHPKKGVRFSIRSGDVELVQTATAEFVIAWVTMRLVKALNKMEPANG